MLINEQALRSKEGVLLKLQAGFLAACKAHHGDASVAELASISRSLCGLAAEPLSLFTQRKKHVKDCSGARAKPVLCAFSGVPPRELGRFAAWILQAAGNFLKASFKNEK